LSGSIIGAVMAKPVSDALVRLMAGFMLLSTRGEGRTGGSSAQGKPMDEKSERTVRMTLEEARNLPDMTDYARLDAMTDEDIAKAVADDPDACPVDADWSDASLVVPPQMRDSVLFVDDDVLAWFRSASDDYRNRMKAVLRAYMEAHQRKPG